MHNIILQNTTLRYRLPHTNLKLQTFIVMRTVHQA